MKYTYRCSACGMTETFRSIPKRCPYCGKIYEHKLLTAEEGSWLEGDA